MHLATVTKDGREFIIARIDDETLLDLAKADADGPFGSMQQLVEAGDAGVARAKELLTSPTASVATADVTFRAPLPVPVQIRDCLVFEEHLKNSFAQAEKMTGRSFDIPPVWYEQPIYYKANRFSVIGHGETVRWPKYSDMMDFECELAIVVGKGGADIDAAAGRNHIFGLTIFNDMSARDAQMREMGGQLGPAKGKDFDTGNIFGPWLVTVDAFDMEADGSVALDMEARVDGERWGGGNSAAMHHSFGAILAHISQSETLHAGEIIGSGTVGTGCGLEIGRMLEDGQTIELEIEGIGTLTNTIRKV